MSREVRRMPLGWKHPTEHNPYWQHQQNTPYGQSKPKSQLRGPTERFVPLFEESISEAQASWDREKIQWEEGTHQYFDWLLAYHSPEGYVSTRTKELSFHSYQIWDDTGQVVLQQFFFKTVSDILKVYPYQEHAGKRPTAEKYMPNFDVPKEELGWCLYETVSEGTPVTPVFATAEELIEHLCTVGQDQEQVPMRRMSAELIVNDGFFAGSGMIIDGVGYRSDTDADLITEKFKEFKE